MGKYREMIDSGYMRTSAYFPGASPAMLKPKWIHEEQRVEEICAAIMRYKKEDRPVPADWMSELIDLVRIDS